jgi:hypothetical protein
VSVQEERELRARLGALLAQAEPGPAPVEVTMRHGRARRTRRRALVAGSLAVIAAVAVATPPLLRRHAAAPQPAAGETVTVQPPGRGAAPGVIATGTVNGRPWTAVLNGTAADPSASFRPDFPILGGVVMGQELTGPTTAALASIGNGRSTGYVGPVAAPVRYLLVTLSDHQVLSLRPVPWRGHRYVAFMVPDKLALLTAVSYGRHGEISYTIPFNSAGAASFVTWLRPGQAGQARASVRFGPDTAGGKPAGPDASGHAGPWGLCIVTRSPTGSGADCVATGDRARQTSLVSPFISGGGDTNIGFARTDVAYLRLSRSDGAVLTAPVARIAGYGLFAFPLAGSQRISHWAAYGADGTRLGSGPGNPARATGS